MLCNENARNQFNKLFFINFPLEDLRLCEKWWKICGRNDKFDPQMKICSIHFNESDFTFTFERRNGQLYRQTILKIYTVPTLYLHASEYTKFIRKRKRTKLQIKSDVINCAVESCKNTFLKDGKKLFFKFPLGNKLLLKQWTDSIGFHNRQPLNTDRICSDHFEKNYILNINNLYILKNNSVPLIKPKNAFIITNSEGNSYSIIKTSIKPQNTKCNFSNQEFCNSEKVNIKQSVHSWKLIQPRVNKTSFTPSSTEKIIPIEEEVLIPKSKNNGNVEDYIYLDALNYGHGELLSFEKKYIPKNKKTEFLDKYKITESKSTPQSIKDNQHLREVYRELQPGACSSECKEFCYFCITGPQRKQIFKEFHKLQTAVDQNCKIVELINLRIVKKSNGKFETFPSYNLVIDNKFVKVCRLFFINTLGITDDRLDAVLMPDNYSWYSIKETALNTNQPQPATVVQMEPSTSFVTNSSGILKKDNNLFEDESELNIEDITSVEFERVVNYIKDIPRVLSVHKSRDGKKMLFETTVDTNSMHKAYSEKYNTTNIGRPPCTLNQFRKIYNLYMKSFL